MPEATNTHIGVGDPIERFYSLPVDWEKEASTLAVALAWAVGYIEGQGDDAGTARLALDRWRLPLLGVGGNPLEGQ